MPSPSELDDPHWASIDMPTSMRGPASDHTLGRASCDSGFIEPHATFEVVDEYNPGASAPVEAGGSVALAEAGGSATPAIDYSVWGHPNLQMKQNPPDRFTLS
ncbi:uncharacterized protein DS421_11g344590 [Arachis hypogaea]|nr:uncharacterized protein DS421_11g344590 [Arachis hypogaea]